MSDADAPPRPTRSAASPRVIGSEGGGPRREAPGRWARLRGVGHTDAARLVRPDGHIGWRGPCPAAP